MTATARSQRIEDGEAADRVAELLTAQSLPETLERVRELPALVRDPARPVPDVMAEIGDTADRVDVAARELDRIYRSLVAPRIEQLRDLEERAVAAEQRMNRLETTAAIQEWQQRLEMLLEELERFEAGGGVREELSQQARDGELPRAAAWARAEGDRYFSPPAYYRGRLPLLIAEVQQQIQEIVLADLLADRDEPAPPEYQHLVERYLAILGAGEAGTEKRNDEGRNPNDEGMTKPE